jgi:hypothetical protein
MTFWRIVLGVGVAAMIGAAETGAGTGEPFLYSCEAEPAALCDAVRGALADAVAPRRVIDATIARALPGAHRIAFERLDAAGPALHGRLRAKPGEAPWITGPALQRALPTASAAESAFFADYANALVAASRALIAEL